MSYINKGAVRRVAGMLTALVAGVVVAGAGPAQAHHDPAIVNEGFESNSSWLSFVHYGNGSGGNLVLNPNPVPVVNPQRSRSGVGHAYLFTRRDSSRPGTTWSAVQRRIGKRSDQLSCVASAYVNPEGSAKTVVFEAYNPATPTAPMIRTVRLTVSGSGYQQINMGAFTSVQTSIVVRVGLVHRGSTGAETLRVDDLRLYCSDFH